MLRSVIKATKWVRGRSNQSNPPNVIHVHGLVDGRHYTEYVEDVKQLKREDRLNEALALLSALIDAVEQESSSKGPGWTLAPWYYEQAAICFRKQGMKEAEIAVLQRHVETSFAHNARPVEKILQRLKKVRAS